MTLHLLLNISENLTIEVKVMKRGIIGTLIMMLDRPTLDLAVLSVTFLKKLSIFEENIEDMIKVCIKDMNMNKKTDIVYHTVWRRIGD